LAKILIVEDDGEISTTMAEVLMEAGHATRTARNGIEGLRMISEDVPDLILLDLEMPILDGPGMARALAAQRDGMPRIPIVVASAGGHIREIAARMGSAHYLKKPFTLDRLLEVVKEALALPRP
jgi:DNA-binding NtrC family response regulator